MPKGSLMSNMMASGPVSNVDYVPYVNGRKKKKKKKKSDKKSTSKKYLRSALDPLNFKQLPQPQQNY